MTTERLTGLQAAALRMLEVHGPVEARRRLAEATQPPLLDNFSTEQLDFIADLKKLARAAGGFAELCYGHHVDEVQWQAFAENLVAMLDQMGAYSAGEFAHHVVDAEPGNQGD